MGAHRNQKCKKGNLLSGKNLRSDNGYIKKRLQNE